MISINTCIKALSNAAMSRRAAFQTELGVALAIFLMKGTTEREARTLLTETYASAGYMCLATVDPDYKTINRRVNVAADLFNKIKPRTIKKWAGDLNENNLIAAMVAGLRPYELWSIADVQRFCAPPEPVVTGTGVTAPVAEPVPVEPHAGILAGGHAKIMGMFRRAADRDDVKRVTTQHLAVVITEGSTPDEMIELAWKILAMAKAMRPELEAA